MFILIYVMFFTYIFYIIYKERRCKRQLKEMALRNINVEWYITDKMVDILKK